MAKHPPNEDEVFNAESKIKLEKAHKIADRPDEFAKLFCKVAKEQTIVQDMINDMIRKALNTDVSSRGALQGLIQVAYKEDWKAFVKSAWGKIALVVWTLITALISAWIGSHFGK